MIAHVVVKVAKATYLLVYPIAVCMVLILLLFLLQVGGVLSLISSSGLTLLLVLMLLLGMRDLLLLGRQLLAVLGECTNHNAKDDSPTCPATPGNNHCHQTGSQHELCYTDALVESTVHLYCRQRLYRPSYTLRRHAA